MKKILLVLILGMASLYANSGEDIYKNSCALCHAMKGMRQAPPIPMVSQRLKMHLKSRDKFIAFVDDYIQNPSKKKGLCMPMAYKKFGVMPPIGKTMNPNDRTTVAAWLYDNFKATTPKEMNKKKSMKCGAGKCGSK